MIHELCKTDRHFLRHSLAVNIYFHFKVKFFSLFVFPASLIILYPLVFPLFYVCSSLQFSSLTSLSLSHCSDPFSSLPFPPPTPFLSSSWSDNRRKILSQHGVAAGSQEEDAQAVFPPPTREQSVQERGRK